MKDCRSSEEQAVVKYLFFSLVTHRQIDHQKTYNCSHRGDTTTLREGANVRAVHLFQVDFLFEIRIVFLRFYTVWL